MSHAVESRGLRPHVHQLLRFGPWLWVTGLGLWMLWPVPSGAMPLSADHTVHLTRIWMLAQEIGHGSLRGWSPIWFFGTPVGELYPVLGDLLVIGFRGLSFGTLSWSKAYALGFSVVFIAQGWVLLRAGRAMGLGMIAGLVAATLALTDVGAYREGGWLYTVTYGVWPQALATSLTWLGFAELANAASHQALPEIKRGLARASLAMGAALLAHPMSGPVIAFGGPLVILAMGSQSGEALRRSATVGLLAALGAAGIAAWWLVPMLSHRGWMASYGWLWLPLEHMLPRAFEGHWTQAMPPAVGWAVTFGLLATAMAGSRPARALGVTAIVLWLVAGRDLAWSLRLDHLSEAFTHVQYQRFLTAAKPGLYLMAGAAIGWAVRWAQRTWTKPRTRPIALILGLVVAGWAAATGSQLLPLASKAGVGQTQQVRHPNLPGLDEDYAALLSWLQRQWEQRDRFFRVTVRESRDLHWFMDAPVHSSVPIYKQGFTPGDNFVHKPETAQRTLLDRASVRYEVRRGRTRRGRQPVATFGQIQVFERDSWPSDVAWLQGDGELVALEGDADDDRILGEIRGSGPNTTLVFAVAGFPRWSLTIDGAAVPWFEVPILGDAPQATQGERRQGMLRGGKALGDDGTEPTLIAARVRDGQFVLEYKHWRAIDIAALAVSLLTLGLGIASVRRRPTEGGGWLAAVYHPLRRAAHPGLVVGFFVAVAVWGITRHRAGAMQEAEQSVGWVDGGNMVDAKHIRADFLKTDMLIRPAVVVSRRKTGRVVFPDVHLGETLSGWAAIDDDVAKQRRQGRRTLVVEARTAQNPHWHPLGSVPVPHKPGRTAIELDTSVLAGQAVDLRITATADGKAPAMGFDFVLRRGRQ